MDMSPDELVKIAQNLRYTIYGLCVGGGFAVVLLGIIARYVAQKLQTLEQLEDIKFRMIGIEGFVRGLMQIDARLSVLEKICERRHENIPVRVERRGNRNNLQ